MHVRRLLVLVAAGFGLSGAGALAYAQHQHDPSHDHKAAAKPAPAARDGRVPVRFPAQMREHTLANMRDHLLAVAEIQGALSKGAFDEAGRIAEQRLGMSSLKLHGAHDVAKFMPKGMQDAGTAMHRSASQFAIEAQNASATNDLKPALAALAKTTQTCVACHAGYKLQ